VKESGYGQYLVSIGIVDGAGVNRRHRINVDHDLSCLAVVVSWTGW
jgi:hypothetical protein